MINQIRGHRGFRRIWPWILVGIGSYAMSRAFTIFFVPNGIAPGGVTGIATLIHVTTGASVGVVSLLLNVPLFLLLTAVGSAVWNTVLVTVGSFLGNQWENALPFFEKYSDIILVIAIILVVVFLIWWFGFRGRGKKTNAEKE